MIYSITRSRAIAIEKKKRLSQNSSSFFLNQLNPFNVWNLGTNINLTTRINAEVIWMRIHPHRGKEKHTSSKPHWKVMLLLYSCPLVRTHVYCRIRPRTCFQRWLGPSVKCKREWLINSRYAHFINILKHLMIWVLFHMYRCFQI